MKKLIAATLATLALSVSAHTIQGTQVLKGSIKTKVFVNTVETVCKVKVDKVKNLKLEDSYGNPAYNVYIAIDLRGNDYERSLSVKFDKYVWINNLFDLGNNRSEVRDLDYAAVDGTKMKIDDQGRIKSVSFIYGKQTITCAF